MLLDHQKLEFLYKKIFGGFSTTYIKGKQLEQESLYSSMIVDPSSIWKDYSNIDIPAPAVTSVYVQVYDIAAAMHCKVDDTVPDRRTWVAIDNVSNPINNTTRIGNWIPISVDSSYAITVYAGDPASNGVILNQYTNNEEWVFDYASGVLTFPNNVPLRVATSDIYIVGWTYIGDTGADFGVGGGVGIDTFNGLTATTQTLATSITGTTLSWDSTGSAHTLKIPLAASSPSGGLVTSGQVASWNAKQAALGYTPLSAVGVSFANGAQNRFFDDRADEDGGSPFIVNGAIQLDNISVAPAYQTGGYVLSGVQNKLYNIGGVLYWNGVQLGAGSTASTNPPPPITGTAFIGSVPQRYAREDHTHGFSVNSTPGFTFSGTLNQTAASVSTNGYLTSTDWNTFNSKTGPGTRIVAGSGIMISGASNGYLTNNAVITISSTGAMGTLQVFQGGTGKTSIGQYKILYGSGGNAFGELSLSSYMSAVGGTLTLVDGQVPVSKLAITGTATNTYVLTSDNGTPTWMAATGGAGTNTLETPSDGSFTTGGAIQTWTAGVTTYSDALDDLNEKLALLMPSGPPNLSTLTLSLTGAINSKTWAVPGALDVWLANGVSDNTVGGTYSAGAQIYAITSNSVTATTSGSGFGNANSGTVTSYVNNSASGAIVLSESDNSGSDNTLTLVEASYGNPSGFWTALSATITKGSLAAGVHRLKLTHSSTGSTAERYFVYNSSTVTAPVSTISSVALGSGSTSYSSGVLHYAQGTTLNVTGSVTQLVSKVYLSAKNIELGFTNSISTATDWLAITDTDIAGIPTQDAASVTFTSKALTALNGTVAGTGQVRAKGRNPYLEGSYGNGSTLINYMPTNVAATSSFIQETKIPLSALFSPPTSGVYDTDAKRVYIAADGTTPDTPANSPDISSSTVTNWDSSWDLSGASYLHQAVVVGGAVTKNTTNYSTGYLPVGPNYTTKSATQYFDVYFRRKAISSFKIVVTGTYSGMWVKAYGINTFTGVSAVNNWLNMFVNYSGAGTAGPGCNDPNYGTPSTGGSGTYKCTFGTASTSDSASNIVVIRFKLTGSDSITGLSIIP